jgi:hypothetical protein
MIAILNFFHEYSEIISGLSNIFTALGTVGAVIIALWISYRDSKPKLQVSATVGILMPEGTEYLWLSCVNVGKQEIVCNGFSFAPKAKSERLMPNPQMEFNHAKMPKAIRYSESINQYFNGVIFSDKNMIDRLGRNKWLASIKLKFFWSVVAVTNVGEFKGKLSSCLIKKIISSSFPAVPDKANC